MTFSINSTAERDTGRKLWDCGVVVKHDTNGSMNESAVVFVAGAVLVAGCCWYFWLLPYDY